MDYANPIRSTYLFEAETLSAAAELAQVAGPAGLQGRVVSISAVVTTDTTVAASVVSVNTADDLVVAGTLSVPVGVAGTVANDSVNGTDDTLIPADTAFTVDSDGGSTAGAATLAVVIDWFC